MGPTGTVLSSALDEQPDLSAVYGETTLVEPHSGEQSHLSTSY